MNGEVRATFYNGYVRHYEHHVNSVRELVEIAEQQYSHGNLARVEVWVHDERLRTVSIDGEIFR